MSLPSPSSSSSSPSAIATLMVLLSLCLPTLATTNAAAGIRVGSEQDFRPYCFTGKDGRPAGFGVDLLGAVADRMGLSVQSTSGPWDEVWNDLVEGRIDALPVVARTPGRESLVDFSLPHTETFDAFFRRADQPAWAGLADAAGKEIVVLRSDAAHHELVERHFTGRIIPVDSIPAGLRLVADGKHDAMLCSKLVGVLECQQDGIRGVRAGPPIPEYKRVFSFGVRKGNPELVEKLNQGLLIVKSSGDYDRIYQRWLAAEEPWRRWIPFFKVALGGLIVLAVLALVLQWLVHRRTRELAQAKNALQELNAGLERRIAERTAALRESNERFELVLEGAEAGIWDWVVPARKVLFSPRWKALRGYAEDEIGDCEENWHRDIHPEDAPRVEAAVKAHLEGRTPFFAADYRVRRKDGSWLWISDRGIARRDADGRVVRMAGSETDISARKQEEEERAATTRMLQLANRAEGAAELAKAALAFFREQSGCAAVGIRLKEGPDFPYYEAEGFHPEFLRKEASLLARDGAGLLVCDPAGRPHLECMCGLVLTGRTSPDRPCFTAGGSFWTNSTSALMSTAGGDPLFARNRNICHASGFESLALVPLRAGTELLGLLHFADPRRDRFTPDGIERLERLAGHLARALAKARAEDEVRAQQRQLALAMEAGRLIPWEIDLVHGAVKRSPQLLKAFGLPETSELSLREQWRLLIHEDDRPQVFKSVEAARTGQPHHMEYRLRHADGTLRWHESHGMPIADAAGRFVRLVGFLRDITEQKRAEQELRQTAEDLKRSNDDLRQFAHISGHDLQEPLRMVSSFLTLLEEEYGPRLDEKARSYIHFSVDSSLRMARLVHDLLDYSRASRGRELEPADSGEALDRALANLQAAAAEAGAVVKHDALPVILGDSTQLPQLFQNLVGNAIKFRRRDRPCRIHVGCRARDDRWDFTVADNGIGIDPAYHDRLFAVFQRLHTAEEYPGTGIGLAICKRIVERHGGTIGVESKPGEGTTFRFTLPASPARA